MWLGFIIGYFMGCLMMLSLTYSIFNKEDKNNENK